MKKIFYFIFIYSFFSCDKLPGVSDVSLTPENSSYSEKNGLLVERYTYPNDTIVIFGKQFKIADAWVTHNFKKRNSRQINFEYLVFFCSFKNINTNEYYVDTTLGDFNEILSHNVESYGHGFEGLGKKFSHYNLLFKDKNINKLPDTLKVYVNQGQGIKTLNFYKYSSLYK